MLLQLVCSASTHTSSSVLVTVDVMDINDNPPEFTQDVYTFNISEGTSVNTRFTSPRILATDRDDGLNAMILYSINTSNGEYRAILAL